MKMKIFGKEPAFFVGVIEAVILVLVTFGLPHDAAAVLATLTVAVGGVLTAIAAKDTLLAALIGLAKAVIVLVVFLGYDISDESTAAIIGLLTLFLGGYLRTQTSSTDTPISAQSDGLLATIEPISMESGQIVGHLVHEDPGRSGIR
jgi:membrane glycosyltransferase